MSYLGKVGIQQLPHSPQKGVTVGGYDADYNGGTDAAISEAIAGLPEEGGVVTIVNGTFRFRSVITITKPNVQIHTGPGVQLIPAHSGSIGLFDAQAAGFGIFGATIKAEQFVNDQTVLQISGSRAHVERCTFELSATNGNNSNPMKMLYLFDAVEPIVFLNRWLPNTGLDCLAVRYGHSPQILFNLFSNNDDAEFLTSPAGNNPRRCRRVIDLHHTINIRIIGNRIWSLGVPTFAAGPPLDKCIVYQHESGIGGHPEAGHLEIRDNYIEAVAAPSFIELRGIRWADITGNELGSSNIEIDGLGDASIVVLSEDGAGGGIASEQVQIAANRFHNVAKVSDQGCAVYAADANGLVIQGNTFSNMQSLYALQLVTDGIAGLVIQANTFTPGATVPTAAIRLTAGTAADYCIQGNTVDGFPTLSKAGAVSGTLFDNGLMDTSTGNPPGGGASPANLTTNVVL